MKSYFQFSATAPEAEVRRGLRKLNPPANPSLTAAWVIAAVGILYLSAGADQFHIAVDGNRNITTDRHIEVHGNIANPSVTTVQLHMNDWVQQAPVVGGRFATRVPLVPGVNLIWATYPGVGANLVSDRIRVNAQLAPVDIWSILAWDGPGDVDLHLVLPDGQSCYFRQPSLGGAQLDFDNTTGYGPEHIVMEKASPGRYELQVVYYAAAVGNPVHWSVGLILRNERRQSSYSGVLTKVGDVQTVATFSFP